MQLGRYASFYSTTPRSNRDRVFDVVVLDANGEVEWSSTANEKKTSSNRSLIKRAFGLFKIDSDKPIGKWSGALLLTVMIHALFLGSLTLGTGKTSTKAPLEEVFNAIGQNADGSTPVSVLFFIEDKSIRVKEEESRSNITVIETVAKNSANNKAVSSSEPSPTYQADSVDDLDLNAHEERESGDGAEFAMLYGRYMGQIKARIERAWEYSSAARQGHCRVQIRQSKQGQVLDINIQRCGFDLETQMSLVRAIQSASPLSAPPSEKVFTELMTLNFETSPPLAQAINLNNKTVAQSSARLN